MTQNQETCVGFIDLEKAFDKAGSNAIFYLLQKKGTRGKLWRLMHKLNKN